MPGFLGTVGGVKAATVGPFLMAVYSYAWFVGFAVAFVVYWLGMRLRAAAPAGSAA